jgi:malate dehydrogenase (oxaloacetate-decarboxylating)
LNASDPLAGRALLKDPVRNKGTAFTRQERHDLNLEGLLPHAVESIELQLERVRVEYDTKRTDLGRHIFLRQLQDSSRVLFYRFVTEHLEEMLPIVYTPTVGAACQEFSRLYRRPHGLTIAYPDLDHLDEMLDNAAPEDLRVIVVTDGERILGLGDQGVGGMGIPIGKLALYTACAGIHPSCTLPVFLDVGTNNTDLLRDPLYLGWRHERVDGEDYERFVDAVVDALCRRFPGVLLQWEDFAQHHATHLLERHRERICSFNDDIQGTAAVALATVISGARQTGTELVDQTVVVVGAGSAGTGIATMIVRAMVDAGLASDEAHRQVLLVDRDGLLHDRMAGLTSFQSPLAQPAERVVTWSSSPDGLISLDDVVTAASPTVLLGVSGQPGIFSPQLLARLAARVERPIVLPLSNPTSRAEATPADIARATEGRALVATGSPFPGVTQANNVYVFPGIGLGVLAAGATQVTESMLCAAAHAVAEASPPGLLLPPVGQIRQVSGLVAAAVARAAVRDGVAAHDEGALAQRLDELVWTPDY